MYRSKLASGQAIPRNCCTLEAAKGVVHPRYHAESLAHEGMGLRQASGRTGAAGCQVNHGLQTLVAASMFSTKVDTFSSTAAYR